MKAKVSKKIIRVRFDSIHFDKKKKCYLQRITTHNTITVDLKEMLLIQALFGPSTLEEIERLIS